MVDRSEWNRGPWDDEPDEVLWIDDNTGLPCMMMRNHAGAWCGYVGTERAMDSTYMSVHGGINWCRKMGAPTLALQLAMGVTNFETTWWHGFDCNHIWDEVPAEGHAKDRTAVYRDMQFVVSQCAKLARQIKAKLEEP